MRVQREIVREQARRLLDEVAAELAAARQPVATYRIQLHKAFTFDAAAAIVRYLADQQFDLAVLHLARPGADGRCSYGINQDFVPLAVPRARKLAAFVNRAMPDIDGGLIGGASLKPGEFLAIASV